MVGTWVRYQETVLELIRKVCSWDFLGWKPRKRARFLCWTRLHTHFTDLWSSCDRRQAAILLPAWGRNQHHREPGCGPLMGRTWIHSSSGLLDTRDNPFPYCLNWRELQLLLVAAKGHLIPPGGSSGQPASWTSVVLSNGVVTCWVRSSEVISHQ